MGAEVINFNLNNNKNSTRDDEIMLEYIEEFLTTRGQRKLTTYKNYKCDINRIAIEMFGYNGYEDIRRRDLESMSIKDLVQYFDSCIQEVDMDGNKRFSNGTVNRRIISMRKLLKSLRNKKQIKYPVEELFEYLILYPSDEVHIDVLSIKDTERCINYFNTAHHMGRIVATMTKLAVDTGLRATELLTLTWRQFYVEDNCVIIKSVGDIRGKGNKEWRKAISKELYEEVLELKNGEVEKIFNVSYSFIAKMMNRAIHALGLNNKNYTFHSFRKRAVTNFYHQTQDIVATQKFAGHNSLDTTTIYIEETNYDVTGHFSTKGNEVNKELYKNVDHETLIKALESMSEGAIHNLNMKLNDQLKENRKDD